MLLAIAAFELRSRLRRLSSCVYFALFFAFAFLTMIAAGGAFASISVGLGTEKVWINAPFALDGQIGSLSYFALLVIAAAFGQAVHQDFETNSYGLFFTAPVAKSSYLGGRFLGAFLFMTLVLSSIGLGLWVGTWMPFIDKALLGPTRAAAYLWPYATTVLPNLLILGAIFFSLGALTRRLEGLDYVTRRIPPWVLAKRDGPQVGQVIVESRFEMQRHCFPKHPLGP